MFFLIEDKYSVIDILQIEKEKIINIINIYNKIFYHT